MRSSFYLISILYKHTNQSSMHLQIRCFKKKIKIVDQKQDLKLKLKFLKMF